MTEAGRDPDVRTAVWSLDPDASSARFSVRNLGIHRVVGSVALLGGSVVTGPGGVALEVRGRADATRVDTRNQRRDADLRGPRLLAVATSPTWTFEGREARGAGPGRDVDGVLVVRRPCSVTLRVHEVEPIAPGVVRATATATLDRRHAGVRAPRVLVGRRVDVTLQVVLREEPSAP